MCRCFNHVKNYNFCTIGEANNGAVYSMNIELTYGSDDSEHEQGRQEIELLLRWR